MLKKEKLYKFYLKVTNGGSMLILTRLNKKRWILKIVTKRCLWPPIR